MKVLNCSPFIPFILHYLLQKIILMPHRRFLLCRRHFCKKTTARCAVILFLSFIKLVGVHLFFAEAVVVKEHYTFLYLCVTMVILFIVGDLSINKV